MLRPEEFTPDVSNHPYFNMQSPIELMSDLQPEMPNRYVVFCSVTGGMTTHVTKVQAVLGYAQFIQRIDRDAPRPTILEWTDGAWKAV